MFIKVGGPNGSGKTTITTRLEELGKNMGLRVERVKGGDILLKLAGVNSYDELRQIPEETRAALRPEMYRRMYEVDRNDPLTIRFRDAHFALFDPALSKFVEAGLQDGDEDQMLMIVVLTPSKDEIISRRLKDKDRIDRSLDPLLIDLEIATELQFARKQAQEIGVRLLELPNCDGRVDETVLEIIREIQIRRVSKEGGVFTSHER